MGKFLKKGEKGFTLIELLIVIVILGVLAAAIIPNLSRFVGSGTVAKANAELASVRTAISAYQSENEALLPTSVGGALPVTGGAGIVVEDAIAGYIQGTIDGTYTLDSAGIITAATYPDLGVYGTDYTYDGTKFVKL